MYLWNLFCIAVCGVLCVDCCVTLRVLQICCITVVCTVKKISPREIQFACDTSLVKFEIISMWSRTKMSIYTYNGSFPQFFGDKICNTLYTIVGKTCGIK
jgi:hypothetical protein